MRTFLFLYAINDAIFILAQCRIPVNTKGQGVQLVSFERNRGPDSCNLTRIIDRSVILIEFLLQEKKKVNYFICNDNIVYHSGEFVGYIKFFL